MKKTLHVLCFGPAREVTGTNMLAISLDLPCSVAELRSLLLDRFPDLGDENTLRIAVDQSYAEDGLEVQGGEEIALILPVSGG